MASRQPRDSANSFKSSYDNYKKGSTYPDFVESITQIGEFSYHAQTNFLGGWSEEKERRVIFRLQRTLQEALRLSGFHNQAQLETRRFRDGIEFNYGDPDYTFTYAIDGRGRIALTRPPSSARSFHEWYIRLMPSLTTIILRTIEMIDEELTGFDREEVDFDHNPDKKRDRVIQVETASYNFSVAVELSSLDSDSEATFPNIQILNQSLLRQVPSETGSLIVPSKAMPEEFGKIDYQVNRWQQPGSILEVYKVSAPSNRTWRLLAFDFSYAGVTYVPTVGEREPFSQGNFVTNARTAEAYLEFFRQRCLCGFMKDVLIGKSGGQEPGKAFVSDAGQTSSPKIVYSSVQW